MKIFSAQKSDDMRQRRFVSAAHRLCILVPFRDRFEELMIFVPHMQQYLDRQNVIFKMLVLNQVFFKIKY
jgi:hypothetical protein